MDDSLISLDYRVKPYSTPYQPALYRRWMGKTTTATAKKSTKVTDPLRAAFGARLQQAREDAGFSQAAIAEKFGVNKATVSAWETGGGSPDAMRLRALCKLYEADPAYLLFGNEEHPQATKISAAVRDLGQVIASLSGATTGDVGEQPQTQGLPPNKGVQPTHIRQNLPPHAVKDSGWKYRKQSGSPQTTKKAAPRKKG